MTAAALISLCAGVSLLVAGRRLFWFFLAAAGFVVGFELAQRLAPGAVHHLHLIAGILVGLLGAGLAVFIQKFGVAAAGFFAGGYLISMLLSELGMRPGQYQWLIFIIAGIIGALLMRLLFGWTLIVFSCLLGAALVVRAMPFPPASGRIFFIVLLLIGVIFQSGLMKSDNSRPG